jgi:metal-sulfur cluster biosynthetic enzyme
MRLTGACLRTILQKIQLSSNAKAATILTHYAHLQSVYMHWHFIFLSAKPRLKKMSKLEDQVREEVGKVQDPETGQSFAEMQMIQTVKETAPGEVTVEFVPTSPFCPIAFKLAADIKAAAKTVPGVTKAMVYCRGHAMEQQINEMTNKQ